MDNVSCEKRHKNGRYCQKTRQYRVTGEGTFSKYVCELHLVPVVDFIASSQYNFGRVATVHKLF